MENRFKDFTPFELAILESALAQEAEDGNFTARRHDKIKDDLYAEVCRMAKVKSLDFDPYAPENYSYH